MRLACLAFLFAITSHPFVHLLQAQPSAETKDAWQLITPDAVAWSTLKVKDIVSDDAIRLLPLEVLTAAGKANFGFDPLTIDRVDAVVGIPGPAGLQVGAILTFRESVPKSVFAQLEPIDKKETKGVEAFAIPNTPDLVVHMKGPRQAIVGTKVFVLRAALSKPGDGPLRKLASGLGEPSLFSFVLAVEPLRELLASFTQIREIQNDPQIAKDVSLVIDKSEMVAMRFTLGQAPNIACLIQTKSPSDAADVGAAASRMVKLGMQSMIQAVEKQAAEEPGQLPRSTVAYLRRIAPVIEKSSTFTANGNRLLMKLDQQQMLVGQVGIATGLLLPAVQSARVAAQRMQSNNNLKQILLAMYNYESAFKRFPGDSQPGAPKGDSPKLSWRVRILPYIEQNELYQQFHQDEPWDSPHNIQLLEKMPEAFRHPLVKTKPGYTVYHMANGPGLFSESPLSTKIADIHDGTSNTIAIIETTEEAATPWTKPGDVNPLENIPVMRTTDGLVQVGLADGSVRSISVATDLNKIKAMFTRAGGETFDVPYPQSNNNLNQLVMAMHNFESSYSRFPGDSQPKAPKGDSPKLSWRVRILPFLEQNELYQQFHQDEPWDSPHNIQLLEKMPEAFRHPLAKTKPGYTVYHMPNGPGLISESPLSTQLSQITDGTSNTIAVIETTDEAATPWTKPGDVNPLENIQVMRTTDGLVQVALANGAVESISVATDLNKLKAMLTRAGGELIDAP